MNKSSSDATRSDLDDKTIALIEKVAAEVRASIEGGRLPDINLPVRSLDNVTYDEAKGYFELGDARKVRSLTVTTARSFAQTLRLMATSRAMVEHDDFATKREVYYISKNWGDCRFDEQAELTPSWTTSRLWRRCTGCPGSNCASTRNPTADRSPAG